MTDCEHDLAYSPICMYCGELMSPAWVAEYVRGEEPNRTWYEVYWPGPQEDHASCDPYGDMPRPEPQTEVCSLPWGCEPHTPISDYGAALDQILSDFKKKLKYVGEKVVIWSWGQSDIEYREELVDGESRAYWELHAEGFEYAPDGTVLNHTETTTREYVPKEQK